MTRRRLLLIAVIAVALAVLIAAPAALAAAGGGSAGFGGGDGGGGGGGGGFALYIVFQILFRIALLGHGLGALVLLGLFLIYMLVTRVAPQAGRFWSAQGERFSSGHGSTGVATRRHLAQRERRVETAAAEAAEEDPAFAPDVVKPAAARLFNQLQAAWDTGNHAALARLVAPDLLAEWERRLDDLSKRGWRNRVQVLGEPTVEYVGLTHHGDSATDRVVVRIEAKLRDYVEDAYGNHIKRAGRLGETVRLREFWTLRRLQGRWMLVSIEQGAEGTHALEEEIVATPWSDERAMRDEALIEGAVADAVPDGTSLAEVADLQYTGRARAAALDLSLADGRFAPDVLEVAARRAVAAWAEAVDGDDAQLRGIARPPAVRELLHPGDASGKTRLVVRGPRVKQIRIIGLDAAATPPTLSIEVDLEGRRYLEDRDTTAVIAGSQSRATSFTERWTFALEGDARQPWQIATVGATGAPA